MERNQEEEEFRLQIKMTQKKRELDHIERQIYLEKHKKENADKAFKDYEREGKKLMSDEVEEQLVKKYLEYKNRKDGEEGK